MRLAGNFDSEIFIEKDGQEVNGKSIMGVLILAAGCGSKIKLRAEGSDAEAAVMALGELVNRGFDRRRLTKKEVILMRGSGVSSGIVTGKVFLMDRRRAEAALPPFGRGIDRFRGREV